MTRMSGIAALAMIMMLVAPAALAAQHDAGSSTPGTNSAGAAQSSGHAPNREPGVRTGEAGMGSGQAATGTAPSGDAAIKAENDLLDRKLKSICRGC